LSGRVAGYFVVGGEGNRAPGLPKVTDFAQRVVFGALS